jgi:methyl-accepting chemotaxis protein WspA
VAQAQAPDPQRSPRSLTRAPVPQRHRRLFTQLALWFVGISIVPLLIAGYFNYRVAAKGILDDKKENLQALVLHQAGEINQYFDAAELMAENVAGAQPVRDLLGAFGNLTAQDIPQIPTLPAFTTLQTKWASRLDHYGNNLDFSEIYIVNLNGVVIYSVGHRGQSFFDLRSPANSSLAMTPLFDEILQKRTLCTSGMTLQTPDQAQGFYYGMPIYPQNNKTQLIGVVIAELDNTRLQLVLNNRIGLGVTGETMVFASSDGKFTIINRPFFRPTATFTTVTPLSGSDKFGDGTTPPDQASVAEGVGYRGHQVLAAWTYLPSLNWVLMQKIDQEEVFAPVESLRRFSLGVGAVTFLMVIGIAALVARSITRPVVVLTNIAERIAHGDLSTPVTSSSRNEIGQLAQAVCTMARSLKSLVGKVQDSASIISTNAVQMAASSRQQAEVAQGTGSAAIEVAATARQISATSQELTRTMEEVNQVSQATAQRAEAGLDGLQAIQTTMTEFDQSRAMLSDQLLLIAQKAEAICGITVTMTKVADQTNLLSLNAAIEARKAGEYGRGFSVVAREIQRLADQAGVATLEIEHTIGEMRQVVAAGVAGMKGFSVKAAATAERVQTVSQQLTEVIQQVQGLPPRFEMVLQGMQSQSEGAQQITGAISHMSDSAQQTAAAVQEALRLLEQLRDTTRVLQAEISLFKA